MNIADFQIHLDADLAALNTLALPCRALARVDVHARGQVGPALDRLTELFPGRRPLILGQGSNVVLPERLDRPVVVLHFQQISGLEGEATPAAPSEGEVQECIVLAGAGVIWDELVAQTVACGWRGLENLSLIPGTVGAAPVQNIGAYGVELSDSLAHLEVYDCALREQRRLVPSDCQFAYRDSRFKQEPERFVILQVAFHLSKRRALKLDYGELRRFAEHSAQLSVQQVRDAIIDIRRAKLPDPGILANAGSFFKNPVVTQGQYQALLARFPGLVGYPQPGGQFKLAAGWMIDRLGWKGKRLGPVGMHDQQALVMVNHGGAVQADVLALAERIVQDVQAHFDLNLSIEPSVL